MPLRPWKKLSEEILARNPWWTYKKDLCELPSGKPGEYHYVHTNGSSMVIPITTQGRVLTVKQYRYLLGRESIEFPCGSVKDSSSYDATAREELAEETGFSARTLVCVGEYNPYNGVTNEMCRVYVARGLEHVGAAPDETEEFELIAMTSREFKERIADGTVWDGMTIAAWTVAQGQGAL
jgi:ADP-ribose pyrophosphatase